ncbi:flagellar basal body P-ring formation chaperone FlgA [Albirhodobacter sp. R86504]|jgi:flagella basal body P-ring formation protein FlgA|uniref:flagellar basal body P-ring formation chaperone FlgA n=1 Tax=Albirhodobacter sp. R86504 TaxID=3093848 RepID=UPI003671E89B
MKSSAYILCLGIASAEIAYADVVHPVRTIKAQEVISAEDLRVAEGESQSLISDLQDAIGMEARVTLYANRPIRPQDITEPAAIERNQTVEMVYSRGLLNISAEGRSLDRAAIGETVRVMNMSSRATVSARVTAPGRVQVTTY